MKKSFISLVALLAVFSCAKQEAEENILVGTPKGQTVVSASLPESPKTTLGALDGNTRSVYWSEGDALCINGVTSQALSGVTEEQSRASFTFDEVLSYPYKALYPASFYTAADKITLPATQTWVSGTFATNTAPAAAYMESGGSLTLTNLCAVLKIQLLQMADGDTDKISRIEFKGNNGEQVSGEFAVDYTMPVLLPGSSTNLDDKLVTVSMNQALSTSTPLEVYIVVPARTYEKGFTLTIIDANGHAMYASKNASMTFEKGQIVSMATPLTFEPTATLIIIDTPAKLNAFAAGFNSGEYDVDVNVKVVADLEYDATTSADFNTIGNADYVFSGVFDGGGYSIKGLTTTNALTYLPKDCTIKNLVIDESCKFTHPASLGGNWGILARTFQGASVVENCVINCDVDLYYSETASAETGLGILTGRLDNTSLVRNCTVNGDINYKNDGQRMPKAQNIGGFVGWLNGDEVSISNCTMNGNLNFTAQSGQTATSSTTTDLYIGIGGIVGKSTGGPITACVMNGDIIWEDYLLSVGLGGICGWATCNLEDCTSASNFSINVPCASTTDVKYVRAFYGGIAGRLQGVMTNCHTSSDNQLLVKDSHNSVCVGGLAGKLFTPADIVSCSNSMTILQEVTASGDMQIGGIVGSIQTGTVTSAVNNAKIEVRCPKPVSTSNLDVGGVIGHTRVAINGGTITNRVGAIHNKGEVRAVLAAESLGFGFVNIGGSVGRTFANLTNMTNAGPTHVDCNVLVDGASLALKNVHQGGVVGRIAGAYTVSGCINTAETRYYGGAKQNNARTCFVGGIAGSTLVDATPTGAKAVIDNCHSYNKITLTNYNPQYPNQTLTQGNYVGGIVGLALGVDTNNRAVVSNCTRSMENGQRIGDENYDSSYRGYIAGLVGAALKANVTSCTNSVYMKNHTANAERVSGLIGILNEATIDGCTFDADLENGACLAGVCSAANSATGIIKNCKVNSTLKTVKSTTCAAIAHNIATGLQILNCQIKGGYETASGSATWTGAEGDFYIAKKEKDKDGNLVPVIITFTGNSLWQ